MIRTMTPMQRVVTTLGHHEPDRVPFFLLPALQGARELGLSIREYFSRPDYVAEGQCRLQAKFGHDCLYAFYHAALEAEAWGGEVIFRDDGPPNAGLPPIHAVEEILHLTPPRIEDSPGLLRVLETIRQLAARTQGEIPIIGVAMSPFSLPVMQIGFEAYLLLLHERRDLLNHLLSLNEAFCVAWANAQCVAGANAICYFDPVSSSTIIPRSLYLETGFPCARRMLARIPAAVAIHLASGCGLPIVDELAATGAAMIGVSSSEDLAEYKQVCQGKIGLLGNLNGITMRRWTPAEAEAAVKDCIASAGIGGGFVLADNHGEIPWQVPDDVLFAIAEAARRWGRYPLDWVATAGGV